MQSREHNVNKHAIVNSYTTQGANANAFTDRHDYDIMTTNGESTLATYETNKPHQSEGSASVISSQCIVEDCNLRAGELQTDTPNCLHSCYNMSQPIVTTAYINTTTSPTYSRVVQGLLTTTSVHTPMKLTTSIPSTLPSHTSHTDGTYADKPTGEQ